MAAKQAAFPKRVSGQVEEATGRFDRIRFDRVQIEVDLPGYDVERAIERAKKKHRAPAPPSAAPKVAAKPAAPVVAAQPVVFGSGTPSAVTPSPQPSPAPCGELELKLEL